MSRNCLVSKLTVLEFGFAEVDCIFYICYQIFCKRFFEQIEDCVNRWSQHSACFIRAVPKIKHIVNRSLHLAKEWGNPCHGLFKVETELSNFVLPTLFIVVDHIVQYSVLNHPKTRGCLFIIFLSVSLQKRKNTRNVRFLNLRFFPRCFVRYDISLLVTHHARVHNPWV